MFLKNHRLLNIFRLQRNVYCIDFPSKCLYSQKIECNYSEIEKEKILDVINTSNEDLLSQYDLTKGRLKNFTKWKNDNGKMKSLSDVETIGFTERTAKKLFDSILKENNNEGQGTSKNKIKGQILTPSLPESIRQNCETVLAVYTTVNSICWCHINRKSYKLLDWQYHSTAYPEGKRIQITDILATVWEVTQRIPMSDIYVMKSEATSLRAAGSDPNNAKVMAVNLQKSQFVSMMMALLNARSNTFKLDRNMNETPEGFDQKVYFLRSTLPFRLFNTLVGNERVLSDQTVEMLFTNSNQSTDNSHIYISEEIKAAYRSQRELEKDMLGRCLFLGLTFMDICIYRNERSISKLARVRD